MARDNVTFKFNIDLTQMTVKGRQAIKILEELERKSGGAGRGFDRLASSSSKAGHNAAASAVNFQTATQGLLNLSTATVQTITSFSNLDRAQSRARMSAIAVARAKDLLNNKEARLQDLQASGVTSGMKYANMQREIATATADVSEKIEKQKIEQGAVNDIYALFAMNIANVTISSMQTIGVLLGQEKTARIGLTIATKLQTIAVTDNTRAQMSNLAGMRALPGAVGVATAANMGFTASIRAATAAMRTFMASNPVLLAAMAISTGVFLAYETNFLNLKDILHDLVGVEKNHIDAMEEERNAVEDLTNANNQLASSYKKLSTPMENYLKLHEVAAIQSGDLASQIRITQQRMGFSSPTLGGGLPRTTVGTVAQHGSGPSSAGGSVSPNIAKSLSPVNQAAQIQTQSNVNPAVSVSTPSTVGSAPTIIADPYGSFLEKANFGALNVQDQALQLISLVDQSIADGDKFKAQSYGKWLAAISDDATNFVKPKESKHITFADIQKESSFFKSDEAPDDDPFARGNLISRSSPFIAKGAGKFKLGTDYNKIGTRIFHAGFGSKLIAETLAAGNDRFGSDSLMVQALLKKQAETLDFTKTRTNLPQQTQFEFDFMNKFGGVQGGLNVSSGAGFSQAAIAAGASASDTRGIINIERERRNATTLRNRRTSNARKDSFNNGLGGLIMNQINNLKGSGRMVYSSSHRDIYKNKVIIPGRTIIQQAIQMGMKGNSEFMDRINAIPDVDRESEDNMREAYAAIGAASSIAEEYVSMINSSMSAIGFGSSMIARANTAGFSGHGLYHNIGLLAAT